MKRQTLHDIYKENVLTQGNISLPLMDAVPVSKDIVTVNDEDDDPDGTSALFTFFSWLQLRISLKLWVTILFSWFKILRVLFLLKD